MTVILEKGGRQTFDTLGPYKVCVGWDERDHSANIAPKKGFLGKLQNKIDEAVDRMERPDFDVDIVAVLIDVNGGRLNTVAFFNKIDSVNGIMLDKDDRSGKSASRGGDDETIHVDISKVSANVDKIDFWVDIYECAERSQHFGMISNAFVRVVDERTQQEVCRYNMTDDYKMKTAIKVCSFYRKNGEWKFKAEGEGYNLFGVRNIEAKYPR